MIPCPLDASSLEIDLLVVRQGCLRRHSSLCQRILAFSSVVQRALHRQLVLGRERAIYAKTAAQ